MKTICLFAIFLYSAARLTAQQNPFPACGQQVAMEQLFSRRPELKQLDIASEKHLRQSRSLTKTQRVQSGVTLPVVVHLIHNNGPENISTAQIMQAISDLNEAYANTGYYDPADGSNTQIQFCLAQRDPANQATAGITRDTSPYTNMNGPGTTGDDLHVKDINRWDPLHYINIWVVNSIPGPVAGYAYLPAAHGTAEDGIVVEAGYFGNTQANSVVFIHEMGHYLGLYHTFEGNCSNTDCAADGDRVCDTPPDQSTAAISCGQTMNSCSTDALSGFTSDQPDLTRDYMDYGNLACMKVFTPGQSDRMHWFIDNVRESLLQGNSCQPPCPAVIVAGFTAPPDPLAAGVEYVFNNNSQNAGAYTWSVDGMVKSNASDFSYTFPRAGSYTVQAVATSTNPVCNDDSFSVRVRVICPAVADFSPQTAIVNKGGTVPFTATGTGLSSYQWNVSGIPVSNAASYNFPGTAPGVYAITLVTGNGSCSSSQSGTITVIDPADTCNTYTFRKTIGGDQSDNAWDVQTNAAGYFLLTGISRSFGPGPSAGMVTMLQPSGKTLWSVSLGDAGNTRLHSGRFTTDGGSVHAGIHQSGNGSGVCLFKLDAAGRLQWSKKYSNGQNISNIARVIQCADGGYLVSTSAVSGPAAPLYLIKTDAAGGLVWSKAFPGFVAVQTAIAEGTTDFMVSVFDQPTPFFYRGAVFSADKNTGTFNWGKYYDVAGSCTITDQLYPYQGHWLLSMMFQDNTSRVFSHGLMALGTDGSVDRAFRLKSPAQSNTNLVSSVTVNRAGNFCFSEGISNGGDQDAALVELSPGGRLVHARQYQLPLPQLIFSIQATADGGVLAAGSSQSAGTSNDIWLIKTDTALRSGCTDAEFEPLIEQPSVVTTLFSMAAIDLPLNVQDFSVSQVDAHPVVTDACPDPAICNSIKLTGKDSVCANTSSRFIALKSDGCILPVLWQADPAVADITGSPADSVIVRFKKTGWLYVSLMGKCKIIKDSVLVKVYQPPPPPDLGADRVLCTQSSTSLFAGNGFSSYRWQDGSNGPGLTAFLPGMYSVTATDACGTSYRDTMILSAIPAPVLGLGGPVQKCKTNPVTLSAAGGYRSYTWSPAYATCNPYAQTVTVNPPADTVYTCTAMAYDGCTVVDSVRVVASDCVNGIFFPNSFTPNHDGYNDIFKAVLHGVPPASFRLVIYNRLGEKVFESTDLNRGWDGSTGGKQQASGGFAWYCVYQFNGIPRQKEKGTLVLLR